MHTLRQLCYTGAKGARYDHHDFFRFRRYAVQLSASGTSGTGGNHAPLHPLPYSDEILALYSAGNDAQWKLLEQGKVQRSEIGYRRFDLLLTHLGSDLDREEVNHYYMERLSSRHFFLPGAEELLFALHGRYTLCLASNGTGWVQEGRLKNSGILPLLDRVFISEYLGANKPQLGFFDACFASLPGVKRNESLMLGDSLTSDMLGGKIAGMHTCWYNPNHLPLPTDGTP